jgi:hypothetical protein
MVNYLQLETIAIWFYAFRFKFYALIYLFMPMFLVVITLLFLCTGLFEKLFYLFIFCNAQRCVFLSSLDCLGIYIGLSCQKQL